MQKSRNIIKEYREKKKLTQEELSEMIGISNRQLQRIETMESETKLETLRKIIEVLEIKDKDIVELITKK